MESIHHDKHHKNEQKKMLGLLYKNLHQCFQVLKKQDKKKR